MDIALPPPDATKKPVVVDTNDGLDDAEVDELVRRVLSGDHGALTVLASAYKELFVLYWAVRHPDLRRF